MKNRKMTVTALTLEEVCNKFLEYYRHKNSRDGMVVSSTLLHCVLFYVIIWSKEKTKCFYYKDENRRKAPMNESIILTKSAGIEIRNYEDSDIPVDYYFDTRKRKGTIFLVNKHLDVEILFITNGKLKIHLDHESFIGEIGDIIVINPNVLHNIIPLSEEVTYECLIIDKNYLLKNGLSLNNKHIKEIIKNRFLCDLIDSIKMTVRERPPLYQAKVNIDILRLCVGLFENYSLEGSKHPNQSNCLVSIEKSISYINKNFNSDITIDDIASHIGYSKFYFCRKFKAITGYTPTTYINMLRIKYAYNKLCQSDITINDIAFECGFKSIAYFSTTFKRYTGISPLSIKSKNKELGALSFSAERITHEI